MNDQTKTITRAPRKWEYQHRFPSPGAGYSPETKSAGEAGWELAAVIPTGATTPTGASYEFIYKRPLQS